MPSLSARLAKLDSGALEQALFERGHARVPGFLDPATCRSVMALYGKPELFRTRIDMASHAYGVGEYQYFAEPLPSLVQELRVELYARLSPIANRMLEALARPERYPAHHDAFRARCREAGQTRPTPLLLRYLAGGENRLHRDNYGPVLFPLQAVILLSRPGAEFEGGEFLLLEQRARQQSRAEAIALGQGELLVFPSFERPARGKRGSVRAAMRHGVSRVHRGERFALGIIFHDSG